MSSPVAAATQHRTSRVRPPTHLELFRYVRGVRRIEVSLRTGLSTTYLSQVDRGLVEPQPGEVEKIMAAIEAIAAERTR